MNECYVLKRALLVLNCTRTIPWWAIQDLMALSNTVVVRKTSYYRLCDWWFWFISWCVFATCSQRHLMSGCVRHSSLQAPRALVMLTEPWLFFFALNRIYLSVATLTSSDNRCNALMHSASAPEPDSTLPLYSLASTADACTLYSSCVDLYLHIISG